MVKVEGGYLAFETMDEYKTWKNQKGATVTQAVVAQQEASCFSPWSSP